MACFIVPGAEAVATSIVHKVIGKERAEKLRLKWLNTMLWGGFIILAIEHIWHGEVVPWPPFLTAMRSPSETAVMLKEMATHGIAMALAITIAWAIMVALSNAISARSTTA